MPFVLHSYRRSISISLALAGVFFLGLLIYAWQVQARQDVTCTAVLPMQEDSKGYQQIELVRQHPTEPYFEGQFFFVSDDESKRAVTSVRITRSASGTYGASEVQLKTVWDNLFSGLRPEKPERLDLISLSNPHQYFPLDSAKFNFTLYAEPSLRGNAIRIVNRVPGFVLNCGSIQISRDAKGATGVSFGLDRSPLIQYFVATLCVALVILVVPIVRLRDPEKLAVTVASYFFSAFSLRSIVSEQMKTFPTLFDCWILTVCMIMMFSLLWAATSLKSTDQRIMELSLEKPDNKLGKKADKGSKKS